MSHVLASTPFAPSYLQMCIIPVSPGGCSAPDLNLRRPSFPNFSTLHVQDACMTPA